MIVSLPLARQCDLRHFLKIGQGPGDFNTGAAVSACSQGEIATGGPASLQHINPLNLTRSATNFTAFGNEGGFPASVQQPLIGVLHDAVLDVLPSDIANSRLQIIDPKFDAFALREDSHFRLRMLFVNDGGRIRQPEIHPVNRVLLHE
jgi:hypothetical protein